MKINSYGTPQDRDLVLSTKHIFNLKGFKVRRKIAITDVKAIIKAAGSPQFVLHIPSDYDYRFETESRDEFIKILQLRFANLNPIDTLKIYIVDDDLSNYVTPINDKKYGIYNLPKPDKRAKNEELAGSNDLRDESEAYDNLDDLMDDTDDKNDYTITDNFNAKNSRENGEAVNQILQEEHKEMNAFSKDELTSRQSVLVFSKKASLLNLKELTLESFEILSVLGKGTFGKVYLTKLKDDGSLYAIKAIRKDVLIETEQVESTKLERDILLE